MPSQSASPVTKPIQNLPTGSLEPNLYLNRDLSLLEFNRRVVAQAEDESLPLLERLRYLCIGSSNLDEFFEIRVSSLHARQTSDSPVSVSANSLLNKINVQCHTLVDYQYAILNRKILPRLAKNGIHIVSHNNRTEAQRAWVKSYFESQIRPLLTPIVLDPAHPFPQVANKSLNFIISLAGKDAFGRGSAIAIVKAPRVLPRVIKLPDELSEDGYTFCLLTSIIHAHISDLFPEREVIAYSQFRVTRDSDLWVDEEEVKNLREALQVSLQNRHFGSAVRLEIAKNCPDDLARFLLNEFNLDERPHVPCQWPRQYGTPFRNLQFRQNAVDVFPAISGFNRFRRAKRRVSFRCPEEKGYSSPPSFPVVPDRCRFRPCSCRRPGCRCNQTDDLSCRGDFSPDRSPDGRREQGQGSRRHRRAESPFRRGTEYRLGTAARTGWCTGGLWRNGTENTRQAGTGVIRRENGAFRNYAHLGTGNYHRPRPRSIPFQAS